MDYIGSEPHCRIIDGNIGLSEALVGLYSIAVTNSKPSSTYHFKLKKIFKKNCRLTNLIIPFRKQHGVHLTKV